MSHPDDPRPPIEDLDEEESGESRTDARTTDEYDQFESLTRPDIRPEEAGYRVTVPERGDDEED